MKLIIEHTDQIVTEGDNALGRIWHGETDDGVPVVCCVAWVSPQTHDIEINEAFSRALMEIFPRERG